MTEAVSLGKGAWDCDAKRGIPPEKEVQTTLQRTHQHERGTGQRSQFNRICSVSKAEVFEEMATMEFPFEGIPTVPPRTDMDHMVFFCGGCRYRVTAYRDWPVEKVKQALFAGGIARANKPEGIRNTPGIRGWEDLTLIYAGQRMEDDKPLMAYHVPPGCQTMIAIETAKLVLGKPDLDSAYWN